MNQFKIALGSVGFVLLCFTFVLFESCKKGDIKYNDTTNIRPCDQVTCLNGGTCIDGQCLCSAGFEGINCAIKWNEKFVGTYLASDACYSLNNGYYDMSISAVPNYADKIQLTEIGVFCPNTVLTAIITPEKTSFEIPLQLGCGDNYLSGTGNISGTFINIYLKNRDSVNHTTTQCSILLSKK